MWATTISLAVARAALREPDLPVAELDGLTRELRLLVDHRATLVRERTRIHSRLRWHLHELFPELRVRPRGLRAVGGAGLWGPPGGQDPR